MNKKQKKYEVYCNENHCTTRSKNLDIHLQTNSKHKIEKGKAILIKSYKVRYFQYLTIVIHKGTWRQDICSKHLKVYDNLKQHLQVMHKGEDLDMLYKKCQELTDTCF